MPLSYPGFSEENASNNKNKNNNKKKQKKKNYNKTLNRNDFLSRTTDAALFPAVVTRVCRECVQGKPVCTTAKWFTSFTLSLSRERRERERERERDSTAVSSATPSHVLSRVVGQV
jgi:hypothetical protein